ncbi:MAG: hypothetical protein U9Q74_14545 [Gemmatimonadota bacterium]|nr:hypothetical protein [Gemmatimonadota bacterium]
MIATLTIVVGCASGRADLHSLVGRAPVTRPIASTGGHVPAPDVVARDRDELLEVLDSIHSHYSAQESRTTRVARWLLVTEIVDLAIGATSPALTRDPGSRLAISEVASGIGLVLAGLNAKLNLNAKADRLRGCTATLYHGASDIRIRYSDATIPQTDSAWARYVTFKDSLDFAIRASCD